MNISLTSIRSFFALVSALFFGTISVSLMPSQPYWASLTIGVIGGLAFSGALFLLVHRLKIPNIRNLNLISLGLIFGWFLGFSLENVFSSFMQILPYLISFETIFLIKSAIYLFACYLGLTLTAQSAEELNFCVPFIKFSRLDSKKKDVLLDPTLLVDPRLFELARSGILDHQLLIPYYCIEDFRNLAESTDETIKSKALNSLEVIKKLEALPDLELQIIGKNFTDSKDGYAKLIRLAREADAHILSTDACRIQSEIDDIKIININLLSQPLKSLATAGEHITIKIQRFGKEPRQGVGYLDDGTMVVVNGGAEYIGKTIKVVVLSIKPTTSGRMIFCNTLDIQEETLNEFVAINCESNVNSYYHA